MNLYQIDVRVYATAYIKAKTAKEALAKLKAVGDISLDVEDHGGSIDVSRLQYNHPLLPEVSLSPAMTCFGPDDDAEAVLVEEDIPETEDA